MTYGRYCWCLGAAMATATVIVSVFAMSSARRVPRESQVEIGGPVTPSDDTNPSVMRARLHSADYAADLERLRSSIIEKYGALASRVDRIQDVQKNASKSSEAEGGEPDVEAQTEILPREVEEEIAAQFAAQVDLLDMTLETEPVDSEWAEWATRSLHESLEGDTEVEIKVDRAECRSSFCRLDVSFAGNSAEQSIKSLLSLVPWSGETFFKHEADSNKALVFVAREDYLLPRLQCFDGDSRAN